MPISAVRILELDLIENLCERELDNPEGCGLDLRVGKVERIVGQSFLGKDDPDNPKKKNRYSPKTEVVEGSEKDGKIWMKPGDYFLVTTMETINCPKEKIKYDAKLPPGYLMPVVYPRSSLQRGAVSFHATKTDPGYHGQLTFGIKNQGENNFIFELGARMFNIVFEPVIGEINRAYSGQHQGGRSTSQGEEETQN